MGPFEVSKELISSLDDGQLRALLGRLLAAEASKHGISQAGIGLGGNQTASDAGVDASITWSQPPKATDWLPRSLIFFQCKAATMAAAKLTAEMRPSGRPRPIFGELAAADGAYIVFATDDPSKSALDARLAAMRAAIRDVPDAARIHLDLYGADKIARWANQHPGVAIWVIEQSGRSLGGWRPYGDWSAPGSSAKPYIIDDHARAIVGEETLEMAPAIDEIRIKLAASRGIVRLVGLSGMGKTRLAEVLFDGTIRPGTALRKSRAIYGDSGQDLSVSAARLTEELVLAGADAIVVVDNCTAKTHSQLAEIVTRPGSKLSLLTIDYDIGGERPTALLVTLGENSESVLVALLKQRIPTLSEDECRHLAKFSGGNARVALKVAESAGAGIDLSTLNDSELLERLFQEGRQGRDPNARACVDAAALVYAFYVEPGDNQQPEHPILAAIAGVDVATFYRVIATFLDWGVVQQRGPQRAVMPPPLANMLAAPFIRRSDPRALLAYFIDASPRLLASFCRRLGQLHNEPAAVRLANELLRAGAPFGEPATLSEIMRQGFANLAPAAPGAALAAFERSLSGEMRSPLLDAESDGRPDYLQLLVHLAHEEEHFAHAMEVLLAFTFADAGGTDERAARKHFLERFWPLLSFTMAPQATRLAFADRLLDDPSDAVRALGLEALDHLLEAGHFSSSLNLEFGAKARMQEWRPANRLGFLTWYSEAYSRAVRVASAGGPSAERAREIIAAHFREHVDAGFAAPTLEAMRACVRDDFWEDGWRAVNDTLHFGPEGLAPEIRSQVEALERMLRPADLTQMFEAFVLGEPWRHWHPRRGERRSTRGVQTLACAVGVRLSRSGEDPRAFVSRAIRSVGQNSTWHFARGFARASLDLEATWTMAYTAFRDAPAEQRSAAVLAGLLNGAFPRDPAWVNSRLDAAVTDPLLAPNMILLNCAIPLSEEAMRRFSSVLASGAIPPWRFSDLQNGGVTKPVPGPALSRFLIELFELEGGTLAALQILNMRIYGDRSDKRSIDQSLIDVGRRFLRDNRTYTKENSRADHGVSSIAKLVLSADGATESAIAICRALRGDADDNRHFSPDFDQLCDVLMKLQPRVVFEEIVGQDAPRGLVDRFFGGYARNDDDVDHSKTEFDEVVALQWVQQDSNDRAPRLASLVPYTTRDPETGALSWSPFALRLIEAAPEPLPMLQAFEQRFYVGGGWGPFSGRLVRRRPLVASLSGHPDVRIRNWARAAGQSLEESIARWDELDRNDESRFE